MSRIQRRVGASVGVWAVVALLATSLVPTAAQAHDDAGAAGNAGTDRLNGGASDDECNDDGADQLSRCETTT